MLIILIRQGKVVPMYSFIPKYRPLEWIQIKNISNEKRIKGTKNIHGRTDGTGANANAPV